MKSKTPGRVELVCDVCSSKFKTHSSNRKSCHKCKPKCRDRNIFIKNRVKKLTDDEIRQ